MCGGGDLFKFAALAAAAYFTGGAALAGEGAAAAGIAEAAGMELAGNAVAGSAAAAAAQAGASGTFLSGALGGGLSIADGVKGATALMSLGGGSKDKGAGLTPELPGKPTAAQTPQSPDYAAVRKEKGAAANPTSTFLTGTAGIDPKKLNLGRTLLGGNDLLGA